MWAGLPLRLNSTFFDFFFTPQAPSGLLLSNFFPKCWFYPMKQTVIELPKLHFFPILEHSDAWCCRAGQPLRLSKIHGRVLTTLFNAIVCFPKGIELSISFVVRGKVTKQPFHHFDKNVFSLLSLFLLLQMIRPLLDDLAPYIKRGQSL